jgi:Cu(I)/Ag(I) efflux system membrane fusion protein
MKKTIFLLITLIAITLGSCNSSPKNNDESSTTAQNFKLDTTSLKSGDTFYQCEMDPEILSDKPGTCPKCGMELEKMAKK